MRSELFQAAVDTLLTTMSVEFARGTSTACRRTAHLLRSTGTTISTEPIQPISSHDTPCCANGCYTSADGHPQLRKLSKSSRTSPFVCSRLDEDCVDVHHPPILNPFKRGVN